MSNEKQQTAVEWHEDRLCDIEIGYNQGVIHTEVYIKSKTHAFEQAKEMEKEQMIKLVQGLKDYTHESHTILGHDEREASEFVDIFYNETYGER